MPTKSYSTTNERKTGPGFNLEFTIDGDASDPIPLDATIDGIVLSLSLARSSTGPTASEIVCNVQDDHNGGSFSTVNVLTTTGPISTYPAFAAETFGGSSYLFGLTSWTAASFNNNSTAETFTVRLTHNGSSGVFYTMGTQQITIHYTEAPLPDPFTLMSGKLELTSGKLELI